MIFVNVFFLLVSLFLLSYIAFFSESTLGEIQRQLVYTSPLHGNTLTLIDRTELTLTDRTYMCQKCEMVKDRDLNAAENLNRAGLAQIYALGVQRSRCTGVKAT